MLGVLSCLSLFAVKRALARRLGFDVGAFFVALFAVQFHIAFYMSRTLPNTFAFILGTFDNFSPPNLIQVLSK